MYIYKILNKLNNKAYIGITTNIQSRFKYHKTRYNKTNKKEFVEKPLYRAFRKYGIDNFEFMIKAVFFDYISKEKRLDVIKPLYESKKQELQDTMEKKQKYGENLSPIALAVLEHGISEIKNSTEFLERLMELN